MPTQLSTTKAETHPALDIDNARVYSRALSERQIQVLICISQGKSTRQIAEELLIKESTVKTYKQKAYERLGVRNAPEAVAIASRMGILNNVIVTKIA